MSLSKYNPLTPLFYLPSKYAILLKEYPLVVKSITSGLLSALGNYLAQSMGNDDENFPNKRTIFSFGIFGLFVTGPLSHFFLNWLETSGPKNQILKLIVDRFGYGPIFLLLNFYILAILEGLGHQSAIAQIKKIYWPALKMNWKVWIIAQYINLNFVPLQYRVLVTNVVAIAWNIYLSKKRSANNKK